MQQRGIYLEKYGAHTKMGSTKVASPLVTKAGGLGDKHGELGLRLPLGHTSPAAVTYFCVFSLKLDNVSSVLYHFNLVLNFPPLFLLS